MEIRQVASRLFVGSIASLIGAATLLRLSRRELSNVPHDEVALYSVLEPQHAVRAGRRPLRRGLVCTLLGTGSLDLRRAEAVPTGMTLRVVTVLGSTEITVPDSWNVTLRARTLAGGVSRSLPDIADGDAPALEINAFTLFGGLSVTGRPVLQPA